MVAIKFETRIKVKSYLFFEGDLYSKFHEKNIKQNFIGIPKVYFYSKEGKYNVMIMDILGPAISDLFILCQK